jgi:signal transduction histidine kinase
VKVDLNQVLEKVLEDMAETIAEKEAKIAHETLPAVEGVPFQMEQLFGNLISNALKYSDPGKATRVMIKSEKINKDQIPEDFVKSSKNYHKISFVDNGIGFTNEYSEKIFEVFQRLHQKGEYSGTGIGLAICRKIVENHHGFIHATSELGRGSAFIIYLPA